MVPGGSVKSTTKGCRPCNLRRIRCDRTLPLCVKCSGKGIVCPGYGPRFHWTNSIASRGRFKGRAVPDTSQTSQSQRNNLACPGENGDQSHKQICQSSISTVLAPLPESLVSRLLHHYITKIAPVMVWLDSAQNEYKRLVISLSETQPILRLAILAISAKHAPQEFGVEDGFSQSACQAAVLMITERVRKLASSAQEASDAHIGNDTEEAVLAAMLILSNHSLLSSNLSLAQSHMQGARILIKTLSINRTSNNELFVFLKNQAAAYDILACTTLFGFDHIQHAILPELGCGPVLFGDFIIIIHKITMQSVQRESHEGNLLHYFTELEDEFELARGSTLMAAGPLTTLHSSSFKHDLVRLITLYHHAGLLYACKRLRKSDVSNSVHYHSSKLFNVLEQFEDINAFLPNLPWLIFIAGICSCGSQEWIRVTSNLCRMLSASTRFEYYANMTAFLQELWASQHYDWILLAREWEDRGVPILAV